MAKQPFYFGAKGRPLFGFLHPADATVSRDAGVVLCNPIGTDQTRSDRTYRHLAERLAAAGFAALRFDLFGTGDSGGDDLAPGLVGTWIDDIGFAIDELRARTGVHKVALVGLRMGATLACLRGAARDDVDSIVLWNPWVSGASMMLELTRLHSLYLRIEPQLSRSAAPSKGDGQEALGTFLPRGLVDELSAIDLLTVRRRPARKTLVIDGGAVQGLEALAAHLSSVGVSPEVQRHPGHTFLVNVSHRSVVPTEVVSSVVTWLQGLYPPALARASSRSAAAAEGPCGERPVVFGKSERPLFGILTPASPERARPRLPAIVLANAGSVNRTGPHRMYVKMARRWASLGFDVLRVDLSGIGDSPAAPGAQENVPYPPSGIDDLREAMASLGPRPVIVAGLCSGGDYAFQIGQDVASIASRHASSLASNVAGAWMLNPRTFGVFDQHSVESGIGAPPTASVEDVPRMLRALAERGVDTLLVASRNDPGVAYVDRHAAEEMRALRQVRGFRRVDVEETDHTFTPVIVQERVCNVLADHLSTLHAC
jgi:alpha-beta hydrolase superfamily lysophospholipase